MERTKGELHNHGVKIHIEHHEECEHFCLAEMNPLHTAYESTRLQREKDAAHICKCWNSHDDLLEACESGITVLRTLAKHNQNWKTNGCIEILKDAVAEANK